MWIINKFILKAERPLKAGLLSLPLFYGVTLFVNFFSIVHDGPKCKQNICVIIAIVLRVFFSNSSALYGQHSNLAGTNNRCLSFSSMRYLRAVSNCTMAEEEDFKRCKW